MSRIDTLREQIDAVRPDSDDLSLPGLAELAQSADEDRAVADELDRSQQFDRAIASALHEVSVPADLLERLLARAAASGARDADLPSPAISLPPARRRITRRAVIALASIAAAALLAVSIGVYWPRPGRNVSQAELSDTATRWYSAIPVAGGWKPPPALAPAQFKIPAAVISPPTGWQHFPTSHGPAVVYDCARPTGPRALLFVVRTRDRFAVATVPYTVVPASGGKAIAAWQSGDMLYVLVIHRDRQQRLEDHVRRLPEA